MSEGIRNALLSDMDEEEERAETITAHRRWIHEVGGGIACFASTEADNTTDHCRNCHHRLYRIGGRILAWHWSYKSERGGVLLSVQTTGSGISGG